MKTLRTNTTSWVGRSVAWIISPDLKGKERLWRGFMSYKYLGEQKCNTLFDNELNSGSDEMTRDMRS